MAAKMIFFMILALALQALAIASLALQHSLDEPSAPKMSSSRVLLQADQYSNQMRRAMTCDVFPRICRAEGSPGPDCCQKQCVDVGTDGLNCGRCGRRCRYGEICCGGSCVNVMFDPKNCGWCSNRCQKGSQCKYGMCNYA